MKPTCLVLGSSSSILAFILCLSTGTLGQETGARSSPTPGPVINQGIEDYDTPDFTLSLVRSSQTIAALKPKGSDGFDFTPGDLLPQRSENGYFHLGDITLRLRTAGSTAWLNYSTATTRMPVDIFPASGNHLAS